MDTIYILIANIFRFFVLYRFMHVLFPSKRASQLQCLFFYFLYFATAIIIYMNFHNIFLNIISNVLGIFLLTFLYDVRIKKNILSALLIYSLNMACDGFVYIALANYKMGNTVIESYSILTSLLLFFIELIIERFFKEKDSFSIPSGSWFSIMAILFTTGIIIVSSISNVAPHINTLVVISGVLFLNVLLFYLYDSIIRYYRELHSKVLLERQVAAYKNQFEILAQAQEQMDSLKHDFKHHLRMISGYAENKDFQSIQEYVSQLENKSFKSSQYINSGNKEIDSILNYMLTIAYKEKLNVSYSVNIPHDMKCNALSINIILGNLLENAITASKQTSEKKLDFSISYEHQVLYFDISNSFTGDIHRENNRFLTTKADAQSHGIGIRNVEEILNQNHGMLTFKYNQSIFETHVLYYL